MCGPSDKSSVALVTLFLYLFYEYKIRLSLLLGLVILSEEVNFR
jgi:hypothetical protein